MFLDCLACPQRGFVLRFVPSSQIESQRRQGVGIMMEGIQHDQSDYMLIMMGSIRLLLCISFLYHAMAFVWCGVGEIQQGRGIHEPDRECWLYPSRRWEVLPGSTLRHYIGASRSAARLDGRERAQHHRTIFLDHRFVAALVATQAALHGMLSTVFDASRVCRINGALIECTLPLQQLPGITDAIAGFDLGSLTASTVECHRLQRTLNAATASIQEFACDAHLWFCDDGTQKGS